MIHLHAAFVFPVPSYLTPQAQTMKILKQAMTIPRHRPLKPFRYPFRLLIKNAETNRMPHSLEKPLPNNTSIIHSYCCPRSSAMRSRSRWRGITNSGRQGSSLPSIVKPQSRLDLNLVHDGSCDGSRDGIIDLSHCPPHTPAQAYSCRPLVIC